MAQNAGLGQQFDPRHASDLVRLEHVANPGCTGATARRTTVVAIQKRHQVATVSRKKPRPPDLRLRIEKHVIDGIAEGIGHPAPAPVKRDTLYMVDAPGHSAAIRAVAWVFIVSTTSSALDSPSSWNPCRIHAPQNHVPFVPLKARTCSCAASAARS